MLAVFAVIACALFSETKLVLGLFHGDDARIEDYPYQVSLNCQGLGHVCGGSIIAKHYVLTAAHCRNLASNIDEFSIRVGSSVNNKDGRLYKVTEFVMHKGFYYVNVARPVHDIAIIKVSEPFEYSVTCQPIKLFEANEETAPGAKAIVTGYGWLSENEENVKLQSVVLDIVSKKTCGKAYKNLPEKQICALGDNGKGTCCSDSGNPLVIDGRQAGIVSWGGLCGDGGVPSVYTEVSHYRDWISEHVQFD